MVRILPSKGELVFKARRELLLLPLQPSPFVTGLLCLEGNLLNTHHFVNAKSIWLHS